MEKCSLHGFVFINKMYLLLSPYQRFNTNGRNTTDSEWFWPQGYFSIYPEEYRISLMLLWFTHSARIASRTPRDRGFQPCPEPCSSHALGELPRWPIYSGPFPESELLCKTQRGTKKTHRRFRGKNHFSQSLELSDEEGYPCPPANGTLKSQAKESALHG